MKYDIINACTDLGVHIDGSCEGPIIINEYINKNNVHRIKTVKQKNIVKSNDKKDLRKNEKYINEFNKRLYKRVIRTCKSKCIPITVGGDHSLSIGSALASEYVNGPLGVIWIDAHSDYNTFETTHTGNIHGLPLAAIDGYKCKELTTFFKKEYVNPKNTVIVGARSIDPWEINNLKDAGVKVFTMGDIKKLGLNEVLEDAIKIASSGVNGIHVSYDLDVIDPLVAPGVSVPEKNGITENQAYDVIGVLHNNKELIKSFDLVEYNPLLDNDYKTAKIAAKLINMFIDE